MAYPVSVESFEAVLREHRPRVDAYCRRRLTDPQDALDAIEETFLRLQQAHPRFKGQTPLDQWIDRIAANVCRDQLRSRLRRDETD